MLTRCMSSVASWMRASRRYCTIRLVQSDWLDFDSVRRWPWELTALQLEKTHAKRQNTSKLRKHLHQCGHRTVLCSGQMKANSSSNWHRSSEMHMCPVMSWISTNCFFFFFSPTPPLQKLSYSRARELGIRTARLPIDEYMAKKHNPKNFHSKILAINQGESVLLICKSISAAEPRIVM